MRNPLSFSLPGLMTGLSLASALAVISCGDTATKESPVHDIPGVILLDNGDDGNNTPLENDSPPAGFNSYGFWYTYDDIGSCMEDKEPNPDTTSTLVPFTTDGTKFTTTPYASIGITPPPEQLPNASDNTHGIRYSGGGQEYFGAGLGFKLEGGYAAANNQGIDFTAAGIAGFRFWAYSSLEIGYIFKIQDLYSTPEANQCTPRGAFPECLGPQNCENAPNITFSLAPNQWTLVEVFFAPVANQVTSGAAQVYGPLARSNWAGVDNSTPPRDIKNLPAEPSHVHQLQFQTAQAPGEAGTFDLIIDNFGFILKGGPADKSVAAQ